MFTKNLIVAGLKECSLVMTKQCETVKACFIEHALGDEQKWHPTLWVNWVKEFRLLLRNSNPDREVSRDIEEWGVDLQSQKG